MRHCRVLSWILTAAAALPLAGCADTVGGGAPTAPTALSVPSAASAPSGSPATRSLENAPFKGQDSGTFEFTQDACAAGLAPLRTDTTGNGTLIGGYTFETQECFDTSVFAFSGSFTITGANGDTLVGSYAGHITGLLDDVTSTYVFTATVTGGTGRFAGATGTLTGTGQANLATHQESRAFSGTISRVPIGQS